MRNLYRRMTFRSKILSALLAVTILLGSFSLILIQSIDQMNQISGDLNHHNLPEHNWLSHWEQELRTKEHMVLTAVETDFCCDFIERYESFNSEAQLQNEQEHGPVPASLENIERELNLLDFTMTNNAAGLVEHGDTEAAAQLVEEQYLPELETLQNTLNRERQEVASVIAEHSAGFATIIRESLWLLIIVMTAAIAIAFAASYRISAGLTRPVESMQQKLEQIADGHYGLMIEEADQIELQTLTRSINQMSMNLKESFNTIVSDKVFREQIVNSLPLGVVTYDKRSGDLSLNNAAEGYLGDNTTDIMTMANKGSSSKNKEFWAWFSSGDIYRNVKVPYYSADGEHYFLVSQSELVKPDQEVIGKIFYFVDITESEELEKKMQQTEKLALVGELSAGAAHEIRNPLAVIDGFLTLMNQSLSEDEKEQFHIPLLIKELERINAIIEEMLMLTKPSAPKMEETNMENIINDILPLIKQSKGHENVSFQVELDESVLYVDTEQIKQVLHNLIRNSIEAMDGNGTMTITGEPGRTGYKLYVRDTGPGIPEKLKKNVFDPFQTSKDSGTGLGLTIAQRILDNHEGKLELLSSTEKGTCFLISLPLLQYKRKAVQ